MGKYDDIIGDISFKVSIKEVIDLDSANKVDSHITRQKERIEEPVKIKLDADEAKLE